MAKELNENTGFQISIKTLMAIGAAMATIISMWFPDDVTRMEFDMKDQMIRNTILNTQEDVKEIKEDIKRIEEKLDKLR